MLSMTGVVTIVQEGRFQLLDDDGVSHHFLLEVERSARPRAAPRPAEPARLRVLHQPRAI